MNENPERDLRYGVDRLVTRGDRIFGWGWVAHPTRAIDQVTLVAKGEGWTKRLAVNSGLAREDVERAFPRLLAAQSSGFVVTGYLPRRPARELILELRFHDGAVVDLDVTAVRETYHARERRLREFAWLLRAVWRRARQGDFRGILRRARAQNYSAPHLDDLTIVERLLPRLEDGRRASVVFDHNMGGGANQYRRSLIDERLAAGSVVLLCTYNLPTLDYRLQLFRPGADEEIYRISSFLCLEPILDAPAVDELFLNSSVSFDEALLFVEWLGVMRARNRKARLTVAVHDYFSVCPSFVLLNADGRYCGIPDVSECSACLKRHQASYMTLSPPTEIGPWRAIWGRCLQAADEVRCFSGSTRRLLGRAYPGLDPAHVTVVPHRVDYVPARLPKLDHAAPLVVGVIGQISVQKGATVVKDMLTRAAADGLDLRVVVIGTLDAAPKSERLRVTGNYRRADLVDLIEANGINMFLFPSICPETFSYVTEEMMLLGLPIVAFDLGAPGERLRSYANARLCGDVSAAAALATLVDFHAQLSAREPSLA